MAYIDTDNLSYVAKNYENEIKDTARRLYSGDTVNVTLEGINEKLDKLISELNKKYNFAQEKVYGDGGVENFVRASHQDIDAVSIDSRDFVNDNIKNTKSHPSVNAYKQSRDYTGYKMYDFINKSIALNKDTLNLFFKDGVIASDDKVHTFRINLTKEESLKIVEFNITYRQNPNLVTIADGEAYKEPTIQVERVIKGKFFIIRHDPIENPEQIIIKAIVENSDNTSNVIDERIIDVKASVDNNEVVSKSDVGPEFDLYFKVSGNNTIDICIGKIVPFKWMIQKSYINTGKDYTNAFTIKNSNISEISIDKVMYSKSLKKYFVLDNKVGRIYYTADDSFRPSNMNPYNAIAYTPDLKVTNVGNFTVINNGITTIITANDITLYQDLGVNIVDAQKVSTNEILININNDKLAVLDSENYDITEIAEFRKVSIRADFQKATKFIEYIPGTILMVTAGDKGIYYQTVKSNLSTMTYRESEFKSISNEFVISRVTGWDPETVTLDLLNTVNGGVNAIVGYKKENDKFSSVIHLNNLTYVGTDINFNTTNVLEYYDSVERTTGVYEGFIDRVVHTSLFDFGITDDNKLLIIDTKYIIDAVRFTEEFETISIDDGNGNIHEEQRSLGFSDKNSVLYMIPESNESKYFNSNSSFLCNIVDVFESQSGIFICDKYGVYELFNNKNLKTRFYSEKGTINSSTPNIGRGKNGLLFCKSEDEKFTVINQSYEVYDISGEKLRYKYTDLFNEDFQMFDSADSNYDLSKKIIEIAGVIYVSIIDRMSTLYNTGSIHNMEYSENFNTFADIDPKLDHITSFTINANNVEKNVPVIKFTFTVNKYGIDNYHGFKTTDNPERISDINAVKSFIMTHQPNDGLTLEDYRKTIAQKLKEEALSGLDLDEKSRKYVFDMDKTFAKGNIYTLPEMPLSDNFAGTDHSTADGFPINKFTTFAGIDIKYGTVGLWGMRNACQSELNYKPLIANAAKLRVMFAEPTELGLFILYTETYGDNVTTSYKLALIKRDELFEAYVNDNLIDLTGRAISFEGLTSFENIKESDENYWFAHYVNNTAEVIFVALNNVTYGYNVRDENGIYSEPFSDPTRLFKVIRPDLSGSSEDNKSQITRVKIIDNVVYFWNHTGNSGIYRFNPNVLDLWADTYVNKTYIDNYKVNDFVKDPESDKALIFLTTDTINPCDAVLYNNLSIIQLSKKETANGTNGKVVELDDKYIVGARDRVLVVNKNNMSTVNKIDITTVYTGYTFTAKNLNDEIFAAAFNSNLNTIYKLNLDNLTCDAKSFIIDTSNEVHSDDVNMKNHLGWNGRIQHIDDLGEGGIIISTMYANPTQLNGRKYRSRFFQYISPNTTHVTVNDPAGYETAPEVGAVMRYNKSLNNPSTSDPTKVDNIGLRLVDDHVIHNFHMGNRDYVDRVYTQQTKYELASDQLVPSGNWTLDTETNEHVFVTDKEFMVINGDATKWSVYKIGMAPNEMAWNRKIKLYKFVVPSEVTYEPVNTSVTKYPLEGFTYYSMNSSGQMILTGLIKNWEANKRYFRRSGRWELVDYDNEAVDSNAVYYYSEDVKYTSAGIASTWNDVDGNDSPHIWDPELTASRINAEIGNVYNGEGNPSHQLITNDTYQYFVRTSDRQMYRQSFANSPALKDKRFCEGIMIDKNDQIMIPVIIRDNVEEDLTGKDPYSILPESRITGEEVDALTADTLFKSVIYNADVDDFDIDYNATGQANSPYSVFPIIREFDTTFGKFVIYKQDPTFTNKDVNDHPVYSLGLISNDYKQIISVLLSNIVRSANDVYIYEDTSEKESKIYVSLISASMLKLFSKTSRELVSLSEDALSIKVSSMFTDDNGNTFALDCDTFGDRLAVYKINKETMILSEFWSTPENNEFTNLTGFITREINPESHETYIFGNGCFNAYKYIGTSFVPMYSQYNKNHSPFKRVVINEKSEFVILLANSATSETANALDNMNNTIIIDLDDNVRRWDKSGSWNSITAPNDIKRPSYFFENNTNSFKREAIDVIFSERITDNIEGRMIELPKVKCLPIIVNNDELIFNNSLANENDCTEDMNNKFTAYDSDGIAILYNHVYFDKLFDTSKGLFGVYKNEIFRNDRETNGNGFIKVGYGLAGSDYVNIIDTKYGVMFADNKNVKIFNEDTNIFETVTQTLATVSNVRKINFIAQFNEGIFIASRNNKVNDLSTATKANFFWYNHSTKTFVDLFDGLVDIYHFGEDDTITDIQETSKGVILVVNKCIDPNNYFPKTTFDFTTNSNLACKTYLIYNAGMIKPVVMEIPFNNIDNIDNIGNEVYFDAYQVFENEDGTIWLNGHTYYHNTNNSRSRFILARKERESEEDSRTKMYFEWYVPDSIEEFGQNIPGKAECAYSDGSEEIVNTSHGPFLVRTDRSLKYGIVSTYPHISLTDKEVDRAVTMISNVPSYSTPMIRKLKSMELRNKFTPYGDKIVGLPIDVEENELMGEDFSENYTSYIKLCEAPRSKKLFGFKYTRGVQTADNVDVSHIRHNNFVDVYVYNESTGKFDLLPNSRVFNDKVADYSATSLLESINCNYSAEDIKDFEVVDFDGVYFFKLFNGRVFRYADKKLYWSVGTSKADRNEVLYDLKITFENREKYNNLPEDTTNSEIDKFVVKEVGLVNPLVEEENDLFRHVTQFFMPHNYYNRASGLVDKIVMDPAVPSSGTPKEYFRVKNVKQLYREIYRGLNNKNLINSRFIKENQDIVSDSFVHKTNKILGDMEDYLQNTDCFRIELRVYPVECLSASYDLVDSTVSFGELDSRNDVKVIEPFDPEVSEKDVNYSDIFDNGFGSMFTPYTEVTYKENDLVSATLISVEKIVKNYNDKGVMTSSNKETVELPIVEIDEYNVDDKNNVYNFTVNFTDDDKTVVGTKVFTGDFTEAFSITNAMNYNITTTYKYNGLTLKSRGSQDVRTLFGYDLTDTSTKIIAGILNRSKKARSKCRIGDYIILNSYKWQTNSGSEFTVTNPRYVVAEKMNEGMIFMATDTHSISGNVALTWTQLITNNMKETLLLPELQKQLGLIPKSYTRKADIPHLRNERVFIPTEFNVFGVYTYQLPEQRYTDEKQWDLLNFNHNINLRAFRRAPWSDRNSSEGGYDDWWLATNTTRSDFPASIVCNPEGSDFGYAYYDTLTWTNIGVRPCFML